MNHRTDTATGIVRQSLWIKSSAAPWLTLHVHAVAPDKACSRAVLLLHGATLPSYVFDLPVSGYSLQQRLADTGWATYALDARGFGGSTRPLPGEPGCAEDWPFGRAEEGVSDVGDAVHFLREVRGHSDVALIAFSWGTILAGFFAAASNGAIDRLVLYAPIYTTYNPLWVARLADPRDPTVLNPAFGAYRWTSAKELRARWDADIPVIDKEAWRANDVLDAVLERALASDPLSSTRTPPAFRSPNGTFADLFRAFTGHAAFDASAIRTPVLLVRGEADTSSTDEDARTLLRELGSADKRYQIIPSGSHFLCFERSAPLLFESCKQFLASR
jgi:alpha-beta hydrolase superfamily lysophospholipase